MATVARLTPMATATRLTAGLVAGLAVGPVAGRGPDSPLDLSSDAASSPLGLSSDAAPSPLDLSSDAGPSHLFGVCGVLGAKIGESVNAGLVGADSAERTLMCGVAALWLTPTGHDVVAAGLVAASDRPAFFHSTCKL